MADRYKIATQTRAETLTNKTLTNPVINYTDTTITMNVKARASLTANQQIPTAKFTRVSMFTEQFDIGSDFDVSVLVSGTADGTSASHLIDSGGDFVNDGVKVGYMIKNTTDTTYATVTAVAAGDLTLSDDIFVDTEGYEIKNSKFVAPVTGYYQVNVAAYWDSPVDGKRYWVRIYKEGSVCCSGITVPGAATTVCPTLSDIVQLDAGERLEFFVYQDSGGDDRVDAGSTKTWMSVHLLSV